MRDLRIVGFSKELHGIFVGRMQGWKEQETFR